MKYSLLLLLSLVSNMAYAVSLEDVLSQLDSQPYTVETKSANNDEVFDRYCSWDSNVANAPMPKYDNADVKEAGVKLTNTKLLADRRLLEKAMKQFQNSLAHMKKSLNSLISSSTSEDIKAQGQIILDDIAKPSIKILSTESKAAVESISNTLGTAVTENVNKFADKIATEIQGVDMEKLKVIGQALIVATAEEIKSPDLAVISKSFATVQEQLKAKSAPLDVEAIKVIIGNIKAEANETVVPSDYEYIKELIDGSLSTANEGNIEDLGYNIEELVSMLEYQKNLPENLQAYTILLKKESAKNTLVQMVVAGEEIAKSLVGADANGLDRWSLVNYGERVQALNLDVDNGKFLDEAGIAALASFQAETGKFDGAQIKSLAVRLDASIQAQDVDQAMNYARYLVNSLTKISSSLKPETQKYIKDLELELGKSQFQSILSSVKELKETLGSAGGKLNDTTISHIESLGYQLDKEFPVSDETKSIIAEYKGLSSQVSLFQTINSVAASSIKAPTSGHFYFYAGVRKLYFPKISLPEEAEALGINREAHLFLTQLCGEFRDRATMIEAKINWVKNLYTLEFKKEIVVEPETLAQAPNVWARVTAKAYYPYLRLTAALWDARREGQERYVKIGKFESIDNPVLGMTVCETKHIFANYVAKEKDFDSLNDFNKGYEDFKGGCPTADLTDYYGFRGDSNFKHYSPESNGMIWFATSVASGCSALGTSNGKTKYTDEDCQKYFQRPFFYRYNAARAGLATWLFRDEKHADVFGSQGSTVAIYPHKTPELGPFGFGFNYTTTKDALYEFNPNWLGIPGVWSMTDMGFNTLTGLGTDKVDGESAYVRIRDAVDRHTDWYSSGFNDGSNPGKAQAYSPFVASSYEMSESDNFTTCGITVECPPDGLKRWMFVFRVHSKDVYTPTNIINNEPVNMDRNWFDETSFGESGLADSEKAWDRLGTALENELDSILYLVNVSHEGGGEEEVEPMEAESNP